MISPGDGKLVAYDNIDLNKLVQIKGYTYSFNKLTADTSSASKFSEGTCLILRLSPTDCHRFYFIDNGICEETKKIKGDEKGYFKFGGSTTLLFFEKGKVRIDEDIIVQIKDMKQVQL